jgi:hypothetical protein
MYRSSRAIEAIESAWEGVLAKDREPEWSGGLDGVNDAALEEVNRLWTVVRALSNTVHGVNNSLQVIGGHAELMQVKQGADPSVLKRAQAIREQSGRAAAALESLLGYARAESGVATVDAAAVVDAALAMRAHSLARGHITLELDGLEQRPFQVRTNRHQLLQLLLNLLLVTEGRLAGQQGARIALRLSRVPNGVALVVTGSPAPVAGVRSGDDTAAARVIRRLASALGAAVEIGADPAAPVVLTLPAAAG